MKKWIIAGSILAQMLLSMSAKTQGNAQMKWINPATDTAFKVEGRLPMANTIAFYDRLPAPTMKLVRKEVAQLATNSAGEYIRFTTNSTELVVRYQVTGALQMPHMPTTGVSGVDLYGLDDKGNWHWARGRYSFGDTISYRFALTEKDVQIKEYRLYLPLYNTVKWLQLGVLQENKIASLPLTTKRPVIVYGTSIMQGACATRPGLAWSNIVGRKLDAPIINLGFSGNGRMEKELLDLIAAAKPGIVVLDCLPNLVDAVKYPYDTLLMRYAYGVNIIRESNPSTPIVLLEHCCGLAAGNIDANFNNNYLQASEKLRRIYAELKKKTDGLHLISAREIGFGIESTVDGTHPNDIGMMQYAEAYEKMFSSLGIH